MDIIEGLKNIGNGLYQVGRGVLETAWGLFKLLAASIVVVIAGIYYATKALYNFAKRSWRKIKKERPNVIPTQVGSVTGKVLAVVLSQIEYQIAVNTLKLSDLEKEEVCQDIENIKKKINVTPDEVAGMQYLSGKNEKDEEEVFDVEIFKANAYDEETARRDKEGKSYIQPITND